MNSGVPPIYAPKSFLSKPSEEYPHFCKWRDEFAPDSLTVPKYKI